MDHILKRLAPDENVIRCSWYKHPDGERKVIRSQRIKYTIQKDFRMILYRLDFNSVRKKLKNLERELNKYTHVTEDTFDIEPSKQLTKVSNFLGTFLKMFEVVENSKNKIIDVIEEHIEAEIVRGFFENYVDLEEYATHVYLGDYEIESVELENMDYKKLQIRVLGVLKPYFQYGSDSDLRKGDGILFTKQVPFICLLNSDVESPYEMQLKKFSLNTHGFKRSIQILED